MKKSYEVSISLVEKEGFFALNNAIQKGESQTTS